MLKILFCFNCCSAPSSSRPARGKAAAVKSNEKLVEEANFKSLLTLDEKDQLLANQIHANNDHHYGAKDNNTSQQQSSGNILLLTSHLKSPQSSSLGAEQQLRPEAGDSFLASTSAPRQTFIPKLGSVSQAKQQLPNADESFSAAYRAGESLSLSYDDGSISPPSSIDIDSFRENPDDSAAAPAPEQHPSKPATANDCNENTDGRQLDDPSGLSAQSSGEPRGSPGAAPKPDEASPAAAKTITSTTKIGDYARLEYSPVEDLESVTTYSQSRGGSEKGGPQVSGANSATTSRPGSFRNTSGNVSRRSSQGIESTSISIASQLSNEQQFQHNLTNMLESANSPIPLFGTIGLPLGPPLDSYTTETAKTSPETTGAALTSASQDSLSGESLDGQSGNATAGSATAGAGAALVGDSIEDSAEMAELARDQTGDSNRTRAQLARAEADIPLSGERIESSLSMATTTSGGLTNPTPTPSEMSGTSQQRKKSKLRAGKLFKKLRRVGSKKKSKDSDDTEKKDPQ